MSLLDNLEYIDTSSVLVIGAESSLDAPLLKSNTTPDTLFVLVTPKTIKHSTNVLIYNTAILDALMHIKDNYRFSFIYLDENLDITADYLSYLVLCWACLNSNGYILIHNKKLSNAVPLFLKIYGNFVKLIMSQGMYVLKKTKLSKKIYKSISNYTLRSCQYTLSIPIKSKYDIDIHFTTSISHYSSKFGYNIELEKPITNIQPYLITNMSNQNLKILINSFTYKMTKEEKNASPQYKLYKKLKKNQQATRKKSAHPYYYMVSYIQSIVENPLNITVAEWLLSIKKYDLISKPKSILTITPYTIAYNNRFKELAKSIFETEIEFSNHQMFWLSTLSTNSLKNVEEINEVIQINDKCDIILIALFDGKCYDKFQNNYLTYETNYTIFLFHSILAVLSLQNMGGCAVIRATTFFTEPNIQLLWLLKKYYTNISVVSPYNLGALNANATGIYVSGFKGISQKELNILFDASKKMEDKIKDIYADTYYISNILDIPPSPEYDHFIQNIIQMNKIKQLFIQYELTLLSDMVSYISLGEKLDNICLIKQVEILIQWIYMFDAWKYF
jgi:hypothetical protein